MGSIPPGTINLTVIQLSLRSQINAALKCALAASMVEFVYAALAIKLQLFITSQPGIQENFKLISASVLLLLGLINLWSVKPSKQRRNENGEVEDPKVNGFLRGLVLGLANPLAIPYWIAVTAYLQSQNWISFEEVSIWSYVAGISLGTIALLGSLAFFGYKASSFINKDNKYIKIIPGVVLLSLGLYGLVELLLL